MRFQCVRGKRNFGGPCLWLPSTAGKWVLSQLPPDPDLTMQHIKLWRVSPHGTHGRSKNDTEDFSSVLAGKNPPRRFPPSYRLCHTIRNEIARETVLEPTVACGNEQLVEKSHHGRYGRRIASVREGEDASFIAPI
jgi:hypothetical protein